MVRELVNSSELCSIGFESTDNTLEVEFHRGGIYQYYGVPTDVYDALLASSSKGRFFNSEIKDRYLYRRVGQVA